MKKILTIVGARPQLIKAAVLSRIIAKHKLVDEVLVHTGQHYDENMSRVFFEEMGIPKPAYNLGINGLNHGAMTGQMLEKIEAVLEEEQPEAVVVYGDTNSTIAGALAAKKFSIKVIHIEAGLRSFNMNMPEEINRVLTDRISDLLICPTERAVLNLQNEGFDKFDLTLVQCGDIMKDAVEYYGKIAEESSTILRDFNLDNFVLATIHRQENTADVNKLTSIFSALEEIHTDTQVIVPLHPRTRAVLTKVGMDPKIDLIDPVGYFDMLALLKNCSMVITDSGGLQKEAYFNQKNCIIVREETEWTELVDHGFARIAGTNRAQILADFHYFNGRESDFSINLYGDRVGEKIHDAICTLLQ